MKLSDFAKPINSDNDFIKASFGGFAGSGKSRTGSEFVIGAYKTMKLTKPILFIDNEKGARFLIPKFKQAGIETLLKETVELADIHIAFDLVNKGEIGFLFIDSLTKVWYRFVNQYKANNNKKSLTLQDWGKILPDWQEKFADKFVALNGNCVFTGRGGYTYDMEENENGRKEFVKSGVKMKMAGETPFEPDLNIWMDIQQDMVDGKPVVWREALVMKDRSDLIDGKTFKNPTYKDFEPVVKYILSVPKGEVAKETDKTNLALDDSSGYAKKDRREIILEKISNEFIKAGFSTSNNDKRYKVLISEKMFGTSSPKELEKVSVELLEDRFNDLHRLLIRWLDIEDDKKESFINDFKFENELNF